MLIRSSPARLERLRLPSGPLRIRRDVAADLGVVALYVWNAENAGQDLAARNADLTFLGSPTLGGGFEATGLSCLTFATGARHTFDSSSLLNITTGGMSVFSRLHRTATTPTNGAPLTGVAFEGFVNPWSVSMIAASTSALGSIQWEWNAAGTQSAVTTTGVGALVPHTCVMSREFGTYTRGYVAATRLLNNTSATAAPTYGGAADIFCFGYQGITFRNPQAVFYLGGVCNRALTDTEAELLEADPYSLVEPQRSFVSLYAGAPPPPPPPPPAPQIAVTGNGNAISDGDATPSVTDHTDFGSITQGGATVSRTFTVSNPGDATLNISSVTVPTGYTKTTDLPSTIAASGNAGLIVRLDNAVVGVKSGDVTIAHDAVGSPFNFAITGEVAAPPPPPPSGGDGSNWDALGPQSTLRGLIL